MTSRITAAFAAALPFLLGVGLPAGVSANPILYIVTQTILMEQIQPATQTH
jgi:hypothetical protein